MSDRVEVQSDHGGVRMTVDGYAVWMDPTTALALAQSLMENAALAELLAADPTTWGDGKLIANRLRVTTNGVALDG